MADQGAAPQMDSALVQRLQSYQVVSSAVGWYQNIKNSTNLLSTPLNFAESVAKRGIEVSIPVVKKIDSYTHIDERSVAILDAIETRAAQAKDGISKVNAAAHTPLDTIITALDTYLPNGAQGENHKSEEVAADMEESGKARTAITFSKLGLITTHLKQAGETKLRELQLQGPVHKAIAHQAWELVGYSAAVLHLDTLGDSVQHRVADTQQRLFAAAANASVQAKAVLESHPTLMTIEKAVEPYALMTKSAVELSTLKLITAVAAGVDLTNHFFANRYADLNIILQSSAKYSFDTIQAWRQNHPDFEARLTSFYNSVRGSFMSVAETIRYLSSLSQEQIASAYHAIFKVINTVEETLYLYRKQLLDHAKFKVLLPAYAAADDKSSAPRSDASQNVDEQEEHEHEEGHHSSHKARRQERHKHQQHL